MPTEAIARGRKRTAQRTKRTLAGNVGQNLERKDKRGTVKWVHGVCPACPRYLSGQVRFPASDAADDANVLFGVTRRARQVSRGALEEDVFSGDPQTFEALDEAGQRLCREKDFLFVRHLRHLGDRRQYTGKGNKNVCSKKSKAPPVFVIE